MHSSNSLQPNPFSQTSLSTWPLWLPAPAPGCTGPRQKSQPHPLQPTQEPGLWMSVPTLTCRVTVTSVTSFWVLLPQLEMESTPVRLWVAACRSLGGSGAPQLQGKRLGQLWQLEWQAKSPAYPLHSRGKQTSEPNARQSPAAQSTAETWPDLAVVQGKSKSCTPRSAPGPEAY